MGLGAASDSRPWRRHYSLSVPSRTSAVKLAGRSGTPARAAVRLMAGWRPPQNGTTQAQQPLAPGAGPADAPPPLPPAAPPPPAAPSSVAPNGGIANALLGALGGGQGQPAPTGAPGTTNAAPGGAPGTTGASSTGTTQGPSVLGPQVGGAVNAIPVIGPIIGGATSATGADLTPVHNAQDAAFTTAQALANERAGFAGTQAPQINMAPANQVRDQQQTAIQALTAAANGTTPSAASMQAEQARNANEANQIGLAKAMHGHSAGGALAGASDSIANINSQAAGAGAIQRATEQATARNQLIGALGGVRTQDQGVATDQAQLDLANKGQDVDWKKALLGGQLTSQNTGTNAAVGGVNAAAANAAAQNKLKGGYMDTIGALAGL